MSKRILSDTTWKSKRVRSIQPPEWIPEYAWLRPIADDNGVFELDAELVWSQAYALRPGWSLEKVQQLLSELVRTKLLFKYNADGKVWAWWVGDDKAGHLPPPKQRYSKNPQPPVEDLTSFLRVNGDAVGSNGDAVHSNGSDVTGIGIGLGIGSGSGVLRDSPPESKPTKQSARPADCICKGKKTPGCYPDCPVKQREKGEPVVAATPVKERDPLRDWEENTSGVPAEKIRRSIRWALDIKKDPWLRENLNVSYVRRNAQKLVDECPPQFLEPKFETKPDADCPKCHGNGHQTVEDGGYQFSQPCGCLTQVQVW